MKQKLRDPKVAALVVGLYTVFLLAVVLGLSEGYTASSEAAIIESLERATVGYIEDKAAAVEDSGLVASAFWGFTGAFVIAAIFIAEFVAIVTFRYLAWLPESVLLSFGYLLVFLQVGYVAWVIVSFWRSIEFSSSAKEVSE